jgi:hypothetical protein
LSPSSSHPKKVSVAATMPDQQLDFNIYGYSPSEGAAIAFLTLFSLSAFVHLAQTFSSRMWYTFLFFICAAGVREEMKKRKKNQPRYTAIRNNADMDLLFFAGNSRMGRTLFIVPKCL